MNHLPPEMWREIFSYLSLNEMADCRLVSHSFKICAEESIDRITHLNLGSRTHYLPDWDERDFGLGVGWTWMKKYEESYAQDTIFSKPFVRALVHRRKLPFWVGLKFSAFLGKFCPNLEVLRMDHFCFLSDELVLLGSKLQFFTCDRLLPGSSKRTAASLLLQFPNLKGFIYYQCSSAGEYSNSLQRALLQLDRPVCRIENEAAANEETFKLLARGRTECLHLLYWTNPPPFSLSQSMAESLVELTVNFEPTVNFCPFALPNLLYLIVACKDGTFPHPHLLVSAPKLRCLAYHEFGYSRLKQLMSFVNHFDTLRVLLIDMEHSRTRTWEEIALPTNLEKLTFRIRGDLIYSSTSLKHLVVGYECSFSLVCPNLKVLVCRGYDLDHYYSMFKLLDSLTKCVKLVKLSLHFLLNLSPVPLQPLIDLLPSMTQLGHLKLSSESDDEPKDQREYDIIHFEEKKFPSLCSLDVRLGTTEIIMHLTDSFTISPSRITMRANSIMKGPGKNYSVTGYRVECR